MRLPTPSELKQRLPQTGDIEKHRTAVSDILWQRDPRWLIIVGPCSIHNPLCAFEYAEKLAKLAEEVKENALIVMRAYFEKPRTQGGWKGFITDPDHDGSCNIAAGIEKTRKLCLELNALEVPLATEFLDPALALYFEDCIAWGAIGARTTASQPHRHLAARLNCPIGFKNSTHGRLEPAVFSLKEAGLPQTFFGLNDKMEPQRIETLGNEAAHLVLRGSDESPNYNNIKHAAHLLEEHGIETTLLVDCAHGNSQKNPLVQVKVVRAVLDSLKESDFPVGGFMLESHLFTGSQHLGRGKPRYGISITDPCLGWEMSRDLILEIAQSSKRMSSHQS